VSFEVAPVWKQVTPALEAELVAFWARNHVLEDAARARERAAQAACVGRDGDGAVCAVGTAVVKVLPRLRQPAYYYRHSSTHRNAASARPCRSRIGCARLLQAYNASLARPESLGMLVELESKLLASRYTRASEAGFHFIGYSPRNLPLFVSWFEGATLLPPAP